jgi:hypothetical protein
MVDNFNNKSGAPGPDNVQDDQATEFVKQKMRAYQEQQNRQNAAANPTLAPGVIPLDDVLTGNDTGIRFETDANGNLVPLDSNGKPILLGEKDDSFPVRVNNVYGYDKPGGAPVPSTTPYKTLLDGGFRGVTDQGLIDRVVSASNGKVELFDKVYLSAVDRASLLQKSGKDVSVYDILDQWRKGGLPSSVNSDGGGGGPYSSTNRVVSLSDEGTARRLLSGALTTYLGRTATDDENAMFLKALNVQERQNPSITKTTGNTSGRNTTQSQTVTGGMDKNDFAERFAKSQEGYAEYQAATTYLDAFIGSLEDNARVVG